MQGNSDEKPFYFRVISAQVTFLNLRRTVRPDKEYTM